MCIRRFAEKKCWECRNVIWSEVKEEKCWPMVLETEEEAKKKGRTRGQFGGCTQGVTKKTDTDWSTCSDCARKSYL